MEQLSRDLRAKVNLGNTQPNSRKKQGIQYVNWAFTLNNPLKSEVETLEIEFNEYCKKWIMGNEVGEDGTPHIQGFFSLSKKLRFEQVKAFRGLTRAHLEHCKGSVKQNLLYCAKEGDWKGHGVLPHEVMKPMEYAGQDLPKDSELYIWQKELINIVKKPADNRTIHWYWEDEGNAGKSMFSKYLIYYYNACVIQKGKYSDIMNHVFNHDNLSIFVIDVPRSSGNTVSYNAIESIKSGVIFNSKYETGQKAILSPHVIVFANMYPDRYALSLDRWHIVHIEKDGSCGDSSWNPLPNVSVTVNVTPPRGTYPTVPYNTPYTQGERLSPETPSRQKMFERF